MKFDILGRIQNMRLPDGKTAILYSIYEAVHLMAKVTTAGRSNMVPTSA